MQLQLKISYPENGRTSSSFWIRKNAIIQCYSKLHVRNENHSLEKRETSYELFLEKLLFVLYDELHSICGGNNFRVHFGKRLVIANDRNFPGPKCDALDHWRGQEPLQLQRVWGVRSLFLYLCLRQLYNGLYGAFNPRSVLVE